MKVLFVCTGNTCRSPMAEAIFNTLSDDKIAISRGTNVFAPQSINPKSKNALLKYGISLNEHISRQLSVDDIKASDLVLTMTGSQMLILKNAFPEYKSRIYTLKGKSYGMESDVEDPFGGDQEAYNLCCDELYKSIERLLCLI